MSEVNRGGVRPGSGRPANDRSVQLLVRITKEAADAITLSNEEDGVADYLEKILV